MTYLACAIASCACRQGKGCLCVKLPPFPQPFVEKEEGECNMFGIMEKIFKPLEISLKELSEAKKET